MTEQSRANRIPLVLAGVSAAVLATGGGVAWWSLNSTKPPVQQSQSAPNTVQQSPPPTTAQNTAEQTANIFWLKDTGKNLELVPQPVQLTGNQPNQILESAFQSLLAGTQDTAVASTIPEGTKLLGLKMEQDGIHVNLSPEFTSGGGSASMTGRVGQIVYTATTLDPNAKVWIEVEGKPLETLGGEGLELEQPMTRKSFDDNFDM